MEFKRQKMVAWYNLRQLATTGLKTLMSTIFGNYADRREVQAALNDEGSFNYSDKNELWVDYISDLGDGFNSTYTMAHLMARENLKCNGEPIKRGDLLIMGGDQVYPTPEKKEYKNRLQGPYNAAYPWDDNTRLPHLFALPGNHDWYDGLNNFLKLFCQGRALGNWHTQQKRSYFALKLPHRYWIWGIDVQLSSDIDKPQLDYFDTIGNEMQAGDKVILCTAEPAWIYNSINRGDLSYDRLDFFEGKYIRKRGFHHVATLTGDLHHYSHYVEIKKEDKEYKGKKHLITAGGGGAFMHPTHFLKKLITVNESSFLKSEVTETTSSFQLVKEYPSISASRKLAIWNLAFPVMNWGLPLTLGIFHLITSWFLQSTTKYRGVNSSFMENLNELEVSLQNIVPVLEVIQKTLSHNPSVVVLNLSLVAGLVWFTDTCFGKQKWNLLAGVPHALIHFINLYFLVWLFSRINLSHWKLELESGWQVMLFTGEMILIGGFLSGMIFGLYLIVSALIFESHPTEAYSSLRWTGYKNFLRIHISKEGATIYSIGVKKVVKNWKDTGTEKQPKFQGDEIKYELIETPFTLK